MQRPLQLRQRRVEAPPAPARWTGGARQTPRSGPRPAPAATPGCRARWQCPGLRQRAGERELWSARRLRRGVRKCTAGGGPATRGAAQRGAEHATPTAWLEAARHRRAQRWSPRSSSEGPCTCVHICLHICWPWAAPHPRLPHRISAAAAACREHAAGCRRRVGLSLTACVPTEAASQLVLTKARGEPRAGHSTLGPAPA